MTDKGIKQSSIYTHNDNHAQLIKRIGEARIYAVKMHDFILFGKGDCRLCNMFWVVRLGELVWRWGSYEQAFDHAVEIRRKDYQEREALSNQGNVRS